MQFDQSKRRDFIALLGGAAVVSFALCIIATAKDAKVGGVFLKLPPPPDIASWIHPNAPTYDC